MVQGLQIQPTHLPLDLTRPTFIAVYAILIQPSDVFIFLATFQTADINETTLQTLNELKPKTELFRCDSNRECSCRLRRWLEVAVGAIRRTINKSQRQYITKKVNILLTAFKLCTQRQWSHEAGLFFDLFILNLWNCVFFLAFLLFLLPYCSSSFTLCLASDAPPPHLLSNTIQLGKRERGGWLTSSKHVPDHVPGQYALTQCSAATEAMLQRWCSPGATLDVRPVLRTVNSNAII